MSEYDLTIGTTLSDERMSKCLLHLCKLGIINKSSNIQFNKKNRPWALPNNEIVKLSLLNLAAIAEFLDFISSTLNVSQENLMKTEPFSNLPWWEESVWIPISFSPAKVFEDDPEGSYFFGSVHGLQKALIIIKEKSKIAFGEDIPEYSQMRINYQDFCQTPVHIENKIQYFNWVWKGLFDATNISIKNNASIIGI
jgi:hypothetical protein